MPENKKKITKKKPTTATSKAKTNKKPAQKKVAGKSEAPKEPKRTRQEPEEENLSDKLSTMAEKVFESMKIGVQKLSDFASDSSQVAKIKFEILNLNSDRKSLLREVGQKLWKLHKDKSLQNIEEKFKLEFKKIEDLERKIALKEKEVQTVAKKEN